MLIDVIIWSAESLLSCLFVIELDWTDFSRNSTFEHDIECERICAKWISKSGRRNHIPSQADFSISYNTGWLLLGIWNTQIKGIFTPTRSKSCFDPPCRLGKAFCSLFILVSVFLTSELSVTLICMKKWHKVSSYNLSWTLRFINFFFKKNVMDPEYFDHIYIFPW